MKKRLFALLFIAVLSVSLLVGCSQSGRDAADRIDLVPETANVIGHVQLGQILEDGDIAEIYTALPKEAGDPQTIEEALTKAMDISGLDLEKFEEAWIFSDISQATGDTNYSAAILRGAFEENSLLASMESAIGEGFTSIDYQGYAIYTGSDQQAGLAIITSDLVVAGSVPAIKDVIAVREGNISSVGGDLLTVYDGLDNAPFKMAAAMPSGLLEQKLQELTDGISSPPALNALADMQIFSLTMAKNGESIACSSQLCFSDAQSANEVRGWIPLLPLAIGAIEMPEGSVIQKPEKALALLPAMLDKERAHCSTNGSCLTITSDLTAADIEAMSATAGPSGLGITMAVNMGSLTSSGLGLSIDASISNHIALRLDLGDIRLAATSKDGRTYIEDYIAGNSIPANSTAKLQHDMVIPLELVGERDLLLTIDTMAKARGLSMPLSTSITLTTPAIESLTVPEMNLGIDFGELTTDGLHMGLQATITNSNPFGIDVGDSQIVARSQSGNVILREILTSNMKGLSIGPNSTGTLSGDLLIPLDVINDPSIVVTVETQAGFAGLTLPINAGVTVNMPDIESLITVPEIDLGVDFGELTTDGLHMGLQATITNSNPFSIDVGDLLIVAKGQAGNVILTSNMKGLSIGPGSTGTLSGDLLMPLDVINESTIVITVQTQAGIPGVMLPINAKVTVNMPDIESLITVPEIGLGVDFGELATDGLHMGLQATIANSNPFGIDVGDLQIVATGQSGNVLFTSNMKGLPIGPGSTGTLSADLLMPLETLNEPTIVITVQTQAGIPGVMLPINAKVTVNMPDMESLVTIPKIKMYTKASWVSGFPLPGLHIAVTSTIANKSNLDLFVNDIQVGFFDSNDELVDHMTIPGGTIKAHSCKKFSGGVTLSAPEYFSLIRGEYFRIEIASGAGIGGVDATIPIEASMITVLSSLLEIPEVDLEVDFCELTSDGLRMWLRTKLCNSNPFGIDVGDLLIVARDESGNVILTRNMKGCSMAPNSTGMLSGDLVMPFEVLDKSTVVITIQTQAGFAGVTMPINGKVTIKMPDIENLITVPEMDFGVDSWEVTPDGLRMGLQANVGNSNPFGIDVGDLLIVAKDRSGNVLLTSDMKGCSIRPNSTGTLSGDILMPLEVVDRSSIVITVQTQAGFAGVTLPIKAKVGVKMPDIESLISVPEIDLGVDFGELTPDGLRMGLQANVSNSNPFGIDVGDLLIAAKSRSGDVILTSNMKGLSIGPYSTGTLSGDLLMPLEFVNKSTIVITVQTQAGFGGVTLPIKAKVTVKMPDAESLITVPDMDLGVNFGEITSDGLPVGLQATITNSNPFAIDVGDLQIVAKDQSGNVILTSNINGCSMAPDSVGTLSGDLLIPLEAINEPTIVITVQAQAGFAGVTVPLDAEVVLVNMPDIA